MIRLILKTAMKQTYVGSMEYSDTNIVESHDTHDSIHKRHAQIFEYLRQFVHISFFLSSFFYCCCCYKYLWNLFRE